MAWTTPKAWATNEVLTAANLNTQLRDNLAWLATDHPRCSVSRSAIQSIPSATNTAVSFTAADTFDVGAMHDPAVNSSRITCPTGGDGLYEVDAYVNWAANTTGRRALQLRLNGSTLVWQGPYTVPTVTQLWVSSINGPMTLAAGNYIELMATQESGVALDLNSAFLVARWVATSA